MATDRLVLVMALEQQFPANGKGICRVGKAAGEHYQQFVSR